MNNSQNKNKVCAVIPFYNEQATISEITKLVLNYADRVILVDDGSTDHWRESIPERDEISILTLPKNAGKGKALNTGFRLSIELNSEYTLTLDADLQHDPDYIPEFLNKISGNDIVIGYRKISGSTMPPHRRLSNFLTSKMLELKTGTKIRDSQCGFRIYRTGILESILPASKGFEAETEILLKAAKLNLKIGWVSIPTIYGNEKSKMKSVETVLGFLRVFFFNKP